MTRFTVLKRPPFRRRRPGFPERESTATKRTCVLMKRAREAAAAVWVIGGLTLPFSALAKEEGMRAVAFSLSSWSKSAAGGADAAVAERLSAPRLDDAGSGIVRPREFFTAPPHPSTGRIMLAQRSGDSFEIEDIAGPPGKPIPITVKLPPDSGDLVRVLIFRGLPNQIKLTAGSSLDDAWAVSPADISDLALVAPDGYEGEFSLEVLFIHGEGSDRERLVVPVKIARGLEKKELAEARRAAGRARAPGEDAARTKPPRPSLSPAMAQAMLERAGKLVDNGDIAGARLIYEYLARQGSARGALLLAQTFDPEFLDKIYIRGAVGPDIAKACAWYEKAADLGSTEAASRLSALDKAC